MLKEKGKHVILPSTHQAVLLPCYMRRNFSRGSLFLGNSRFSSKKERVISDETFTRYSVHRKASSGFSPDLRLSLSVNWCQGPDLTSDVYRYYCESVACAFTECYVHERVLAIIADDWFCCHICCQLRFTRTLLEMLQLLEHLKKETSPRSCSSHENVLLYGNTAQCSAPFTNKI